MPPELSFAARTTSVDQESGRDAPLRPATAAVVLTFLAPADQCNQRCPGCIIDDLEEPVRHARLSPADYARFTEAFIVANVSVRAVSFQGFEVTLPRSWPYLDAVFRVAERAGIRRSFITNGMLLDRYVDQVRQLGVDRISVSLDGADPASNDRIRGLDGAFSATARSLRRFLERAPELATRLSVVSTVHDEGNFESLRRMPVLLADLGIPRWTLGFGLVVREGRARFSGSRERYARWASALGKEAHSVGIRVHLNDEFGFFRGLERELSPLRVSHLNPADRILRIDPAGYVRIDRETYARREPAMDRRWDPSTDDPLDYLG